MNRLQLLTRFGIIKENYFKVHARAIQNVQFSSNSSDDETKAKKKVDQKNKSQEALNKLNNLLKTMIEDDVTSSKAQLNLAKPVNRRRKNVKEEEGTRTAKVETPEAQITKAVKNVAESLGGDVKQTESELLTKLLNTVDKKSASLSDLVKGMTIDKEQSANEKTKAQQVRQILQGREDRPIAGQGRPRASKIEGPLEKIDLFGSAPLGIFTEDETYINEGVENRTWDQLYQRDLKLAVTHPPSNYFQQMILWTEQGKVWKFPIDNEQGLEEEQKVYFTEHVFLEKHLEPWCPPKGPLRHFMELVCVGLSKNPYLTVEMKKEHIDWFKNYFEDKKQLLKEVGLMHESERDSRNDRPKQIEQ